MSELELIREYLTLVRSSLMRARVQRQEAIVLADYAKFVGPDEDQVERIRFISNMAWCNRGHARTLLVKIERLNGRLFLQGGSQAVFPLEKFLDGKNFKRWPEYQAEYSKSDLFKGVDPDS